MHDADVSIQDTRAQRVFDENKNNTHHTPGHQISTQLNIWFCSIVLVSTLHSCLMVTLK